MPAKAGIFYMAQRPARASNKKARNLRASNHSG
jgi:hypothetical protein